MNKSRLLFLLLTFHILGLNAQDPQNYLLQHLTSTGYSAYDWQFEPFKTDAERAGLKGKVNKAVIEIIDKMGSAINEQITDTVFYNAQGNIAQIVIPHFRSTYPYAPMQPDHVDYLYDEQKRLKSYTRWTLAETANGDNWQQHVHTITRDAEGKPLKETYRAYSKERDGSWKEFGIEPLRWVFSYDAQGNLTGGRGALNNMALTYRNNQLVKMQEENFAKPVTYTYDSNGRLTGMSFYMIDGMDEPEYYENTVSITYDAQGNMEKAVKEQWVTTTRWVRKSLMLKTSYDFAYKFDNQGNWTQIVMYWKDKYNPRTMGITLNRKLTYGQSEVSQTPAPQAATQPKPLSKEAINDLMTLGEKLNKMATLTDIKKELEKNGFKWEQNYDYFISFTKGTDIYGQATRSQFAELNRINFDVFFNPEELKQLLAERGYKYHETQQKQYEGNAVYFYYYLKGATKFAYAHMPSLNVSTGLIFENR